MLYVVTGGSGSGKSEFAEKLTLNLKQNNKEAVNEANQAGSLWYIATMKPLAGDEEQEKKILRHQNMRAGKGFVTKECYLNIGQLEFCHNEVVLLECMSNLLANEMYDRVGCFLDKLQVFKAFDIENNNIAKELVKEYIIEPILSISQQVKHLVVVTNEIFNDGEIYGYDEETRLYIELLGYINRELATECHGFVEVFCGIPLWQKGEVIDV